MYDLNAKISKILFMFVFFCSAQCFAEPIKHDVRYPDGNRPFPAIVTLHTSGGYGPTKKWIENYKSKVWTERGYVVYAPDFFKRHGITPKSRMDTFSVYREKIERELSEMVELVKKDPKVDGKNVFAIGFSNGGFWASYLAGTQKVNAGASHYGVWKANMGRSIENPFPMEYFTKNSNPVLALHGADDGTQRMRHVQQAWDIVLSSGAKITTHVYPGADHAWDSKSKRFDAWNPQITQDALKRTITFFESNLRK